MATAEYSASVNAARAPAQGSNLVGASVSAAATAASTGTHGATFTAALSTLVADGASPTQAHVTAVNNAWTAYKVDIDAATAAGAAVTGDMILYIGNVANVADMNKLRNAIRQIELQIAGTGFLSVGSPTPRSP